MNYIEQARKVLELIKEHAPTDKDRQFLDETFHEFIVELPEQRVSTIFVEAFHDGIVYGRWPWNYSKN